MNKTLFDLVYIDNDKIITMKEDGKYFYLPRRPVEIVFNQLFFVVRGTSPSS